MQATGSESGSAAVALKANFNTLFNRTFLDPHQFGAVGDGSTDDTDAIQDALDAANTLKGAGVILRPLNYKIAGQLIVPARVTLQGSYTGPLANPWIGYGESGYFLSALSGGTTLSITGGSGGSAVGDSAITILGNAVLRGVSIYYPGQDPTSVTPTAFPPAIRMRGQNPTVEAVELVNPYIGIDINNSGGDGEDCTVRPTVRDVTGQPLSIGVRVGNANDAGGGTNTGILDIGRFIDIHFNPWFAAPGSNAYTWMHANGTAFWFVDSDETMARGLFCYGYGYGFRFTKSNRGTYGHFDQCSADVCKYPLTITGSRSSLTGLRFNSFSGSTSDDTDLVTIGSGAGPVLFTSLGGNGSIASIINNAGIELLTVFGGMCQFGSGGVAGIRSSAGKVIIHGFDFSRSDAAQVALTGGQAIVLGCNYKGTKRMTGTVTEANNVGDIQNMIDLFTGTAGNLEAHTSDTNNTWTKSGGDTLKLTGSGTIYNDGTAQGVYVSNWTPPSANYDVKGVLHKFSGVGSAAITARCTAVDTFYLGRYNPGTGKYEMYVQKGGSWTLLADATATFNDATEHTMVLRVATNGGSVDCTLYVDGVSTLTGTDSTSPITSAGSAGVWIDGASGMTTTTGMHLTEVQAAPSLV